ncbi:MAG TPA: hypothetical protein VM656_01190 [Pyrinomonadaceae bacterium]|jgi:hypothetical protein|nr:hypothetical protein [Pyrinomonadaceae bacterium]
MRQIFILMAVVFFVPASIAAQTVTLSGSVSETVTLSVSRITLSGDDDRPSVIRVPLLVRSNSGFKISAVFESQTAELSELSVVDVHATGSLVSPQVVNTVDRRREGDVVLRGPRVSLGGTLNSPNNALQVTLLIRVKPQSVSGWMGYLTLAGSPTQ